MSNQSGANIERHTVALRSRTGSESWRDPAGSQSERKRNSQVPACRINLFIDRIKPGKPPRNQRMSDFQLFRFSPPCKDSSLLKRYPSGMTTANSGRIRGASKRGQAVLFVTLSLPVMLGLLGLVVDVGWMYWRREACLTAAQSGALAAAVSASKSTTTYPATCSTTTSLWCSATPVQCATSPTNPPTNNFQTACLYAKANGFSPANARQNVQVSANNGSTSSAPNVSPSYYITVTVTESIPLTFLAALGSGYFGVASASATGGIITTPSGGCVYILDPSGKDALNASNNAQITPSCGVQVASNNTEAMIATGSAKVATTGTPPACDPGSGRIRNEQQRILQPDSDENHFGVRSAVQHRYPLDQLHRKRVPCHQLPIHRVQHRRRSVYAYQRSRQRQLLEPALPTPQPGRLLRNRHFPGHHRQQRQ